MTIGGLQKLTLIDYPGKIACTVFTVGCNFRCPFCHNPELVGAQYFNQNLLISESDFFKFLKSRQGLLEGVCVTGGEPLLHVDLPDFLKKIKSLGFLIKLDTNGSRPSELQNLIKDGLVDYLAMDIKTSLKIPNSKIQIQNFYEKVCGVRINLEDIKQSIKVIMASGLDYEFRTTVVPGLHTAEDIVQIAEEIRGAKKYYLQQFVVSEKLLDLTYKTIKPYPTQFLFQLRDKIKNWFEVCEVRE